MRIPLSASVTFRPIWLIHSPLATAAMPPISTLRVDNSTKNSTMNVCRPFRVHTSTVKKSAATISSQCRLRKFLPRRLPAPLQCRLHAVSLQNVSDRAASNLVAQIGQCTLDPTITPIPVLFCQSDHQGLDIDGFSRTAWPTLLCSIVLVGNQFPVPSQQGLGRGDSG